MARRFAQIPTTQRQNRNSGFTRTLHCVTIFAMVMRKRCR
ncbi:hypothetical protein HMPREF3207_00683 [Citrobacter koseri]|nr:hypothetical protein HMPREF3207_00683 [Citrobacter koseri]